mgnify:CR=1 FL=1
MSKKTTEVAKTETKTETKVEEKKDEYQRLINKNKRVIADSLTY